MKFNNKNFVFCIGLFCFYACLNNAFAANEVPEGPDFSVIDVDTGTAAQQTIFQVRAADSPLADLVIISVISENERRIRVLSAISQYEETLVDQLLPEDVIFADAGQWQTDRVLLLVSAVGAKRLAYETDKAKNTQLRLLPFLNFESVYRTRLFDQVPRVNIFKDINDDGLSDLVIPSFTGYKVYTQQADGEFSAALNIDAEPSMALSYSNQPEYQNRNMFLADMNQDARKDIVFWRQGVFSIYRQLASGEFDAKVLQLVSSVAFEADGIDGISVRFGNEDQSNKQVVVMMGLKDLDGDQITDLVTQSVLSKGVLSKQTTTSYYRGYATQEGLVNFETKATSSIESNGFQYRLVLRDLNKDDKIDIAVSSVEFGVAKIIRALLTGSMKTDLRFYPLEVSAQGQSIYAAKPAMIQTIEAKFSLSSGELWMPFVLISDTNGDQRDDLVVQDGPDKLLIYQGMLGKKVFSSTAQTIVATMPSDPDNVFRTKLDNDDIWDMIFKIPPPKGDKSMSHRVVLLVSQKPK